MSKGKLCLERGSFSRFSSTRNHQPPVRVQLSILEGWYGYHIETAAKLRGTSAWIVAKTSYERLEENQLELQIPELLKNAGYEPLGKVKLLDAVYLFEGCTPCLRIVTDRRSRVPKLEFFHSLTDGTKVWRPGGIRDLWNTFQRLV